MLYEKGPHHHQLSPAGIEGKLENTVGDKALELDFILIL